MSKLQLSRWLTWPATAVLVAGCTFPPPLPMAPPSLPLPAQSSSAAPVLIPTHTPATENAHASSLTLAQQQLLARLPALSLAPELQNEVWLNSEPLQLSALRGKVVMIEFWTYG